MASLTMAEAARRLAEHGPNEVAEAPPRPLREFLGHFWAPVPWMLEASILLQLLIGEFVEAAVISALLIFNAALAFLQSARARTALAALKSRLAVNAAVRRDGNWVTLPARELVPGDEVRLALGAIVPADVRVVSGEILLDQSMLTGESEPVEAGPGRPAYAGAVIRRGAALAEVTATGARTYSGRTAELVRLAHSDSAEQRAVLAVVRNLALFNGMVLLLMLGYADAHGMGLGRVIPLVLSVLLASVPVALPATFTLAAALGAQRLAERGVLPTRLSAVQEAASMSVLCSDKTGTLTLNALTVMERRPAPGFDEAGLLRLAALASGEDDPVDLAVRAAAGALPESGMERAAFTPFDPARKLAEAQIMVGSERWRVVKGAPAAVEELAAMPDDMRTALTGMARAGRRVLAVAAGPEASPAFAGLIALSDPPRSDAAPLLAELAGLGITTVMVTGDATATAAAVAAEIGLVGAVCPDHAIPDRIAPGDYAIFAGVFPEDKFRLVKAFQKSGHTVGMCGDGANDAPALRQAQIGIAVSTATDAAKAAAGMVLTRPGLSGIVEAVREGRSTYQRVLTYTLNALIKKVETVLFLGIGLVMTGHAVLTPMLMVLLLLTNDFLTMSLTADAAAPTPGPSVWRVGSVSLAAFCLGLAKLAFSAAILAYGHYRLRLDIGSLRTLAFLTLVLGSQATIYVVRERRRLWSSRPSRWILLSSLVDLGVGGAVAFGGGIAPALPIGPVAALLGAASVFALLLDLLKSVVFRVVRIA